MQTIYIGTKIRIKDVYYIEPTYELTSKVSQEVSNNGFQLSIRGFRYFTFFRNIV